MYISYHEILFKRRRKKPVPVVVALAVRAVAGFDAVVEVRVAPTADFVTVLVVVVFFVTVDETPAKRKTKRKIVINL